MRSYGNKHCNSPKVVYLHSYITNLFYFITYQNYVPRIILNVMLQDGAMFPQKVRNGLVQIGSIKDLS